MDVHQDDSGKRGVLDDTPNITEQSAQTSSVTCGVGKDITMAKDECSQEHDKIDNKKLTTDERRRSYKSDKNDMGLSTDQYGSKKETGQLKASAESACKEECDEKIFQETPDKNSQMSYLPKLSDHETAEPEDENRKYKRNLKKFLEDNVFLKEVRSRSQNKMSEKEIKSDSEVAKIINYCGNVSNISLVLSKFSFKRSSAPPTLEDESTKSVKLFSRHPEKLCSVIELGETGIQNSKTPVSIKSGESSLSKNDSDSSMKTVPKYFKVPVTPTCLATTSGESLKPRKHSSEKMQIKDNETPPVIKRPTAFSFKPRKAFYTFSPDSCSVLRQCQSLPNISKHPRREQKQRRSLILDERSRIVRSLFSDKSELSTPKTKKSAVSVGNVTNYSTESSSNIQHLGPAQGKSLAKGNLDPDRKSKFCRKLTFASPAGDESAEDLSTKHEAGRRRSDSPQKRKETSPQFVEHSPTSAKKVRISPELKKGEEDTSSTSLQSITGHDRKVSDKRLDKSDEKKLSPVKRKAQELEDSSCSKKK